MKNFIMSEAFIGTIAVILILTTVHLVLVAVMEHKPSTCLEVSR